MLRKLIIVFTLLFVINSRSQNNFRIVNNQNKESVRFKFINNQVLIPVLLNGIELTFLLDTGVKQSLLFNTTISSDLKLNQLKKHTIRGLGENTSFNAYKSQNNLLRINNIVCPDFEMLMILDKKFDFSARLGQDVHGIIGSELFKDFIIEVNYSKKRIYFNNPENYTYKKCKKCNTFPLTFHYQKPYLNATINTANGETLPVKLLIDSGSGDSLWLFENSFLTYTIPSKNFKDMLGRGLSGDIFGKRSKLTSFKIGDFIFCNLIVSHPDSTSSMGNNIYFKRNGLIGAELLKRFHIIYDYPHSKITLKKNNHYYKNPFTYNKTGIEIVHYGKVLVKEQKTKISFSKNSYETMNKAQVFSSYSFSYRNAYQISQIKPNSIADKAGLKVGDLITKINGSKAYNFTIQQIMNKFSANKNKILKIQIKRNYMSYNFELILKDLI